MIDPSEVRRPIKARKIAWLQSIAAWLTRLGIKPNWISLASIVCALIGSILLIVSHRFSGTAKSICLILSAFSIQARLLCNLFDGLVAIEGGQKTKSGEIYNDLPDRISDPLILVSAGYAIPSVVLGPFLGWLAGCLAILTAYIRVLGGACGVKQHFLGPMAKQQRMAMMTVALIVAAAVEPWEREDDVLIASLILISIGSLITCGRRLRVIVRELEAK